MGYDATQILKDQDGKPIPQWYDAVDGVFRPLTGKELPVSNIELWGADTSTRPDADAVDVGTIFIAINGGDHTAYQSDGTSWVEV